MRGCCFCIDGSNNICRQEDVSEVPNHKFQRQTTHRPYQCHVCRQLAWNHANVCTVCHYACHDECVSKVDISCLPLVNYQLISALALERRMSTFKTMPVVRKEIEEERPLQLELTYITERIIGMLFPSVEHETFYRSSVYDAGLMLRNKHGGNYMIINLSSRREDLKKIQNQILEFGWPESLAPSLERLCSICKLIDQWLNADPKNVVVLHCKGGLGRMGVTLSAYVDYCNVCASADQELDQFAMKHFCDKKLGTYTIPSQRRYAHYFAGLLTGAIRVNRRPLFLYKIRIRGWPCFNGRSNCRIFVKIYQAMVPVYVSGVYASSNSPSIFVIPLDSCLQLHGDVLLKCFCKSLISQSSRNDLIFQCQFHTCAVLGCQLKFGKSDLDREFSDLPFADDGQVELFFAESPDDVQKYDTLDEPSILIDSSPNHLRQSSSYEDIVSLAEESPTAISGLTYQDPVFRMQCAYSSLQSDKPRNGIGAGLQPLNQNHVSVGSKESNSFQFKGNAAKLSPCADYPVSDCSSTSTDAMNTTVCGTSKFCPKGNIEDISLDDILQGLMQEQKLMNSCQTLDDSKRHLYTQFSTHNTGTIGGNSGANSWHRTVESAPVRCQIGQSSTSQSVVQNSPKETNINKWGLSKPCMWSNGETKIETSKPEKSHVFDPPGQRLVKMLEQEHSQSGSRVRLHSPDVPSVSKETLRFNASGLNGTMQKPHDTLTRSKSYGYRNCASDTEDQMSWLEEQHSKLRNKREVTLLKQRSQQEKRLISELKMAQNTIRSSKRSQSDTEDLSPDGRDDFRTQVQHLRTINQYHENIGMGCGHGHTSQTTRSPMHQLEINCDRPLKNDSYSQNMENRILVSPRNQQLSPDKSLSVNGIRNGQMSFESSTLNGFDSPPTPLRGESSRHAMKQVYVSDPANDHEAQNLDELERTLKMTLQSMSRSKISVTGVPQGHILSDKKENSSSVNAWPKLRTLGTEESEEQEVIELKPIGQGVRTLEPGTNSQASSDSYPVQVVVSPFPLSPVTAYDNNGLSTVKRGMPGSASVPLSLSSNATPTGNSMMSPTSAISDRGDNITLDLQQQQHLIKQQLLQQQVKQQQLQQQLQQLQLLQQQHHLLKQKLQEHRQQQQLIQQQQHQVGPNTHYQLMQQQQMFEQQLLQQQQQLLLLQQQLQQQQQVQQVEPQQQVQWQQEQSGVFVAGVPHQNEISAGSFAQRATIQNQNIKSMKNASNASESSGRKNAQITRQAPRSENSGVVSLQNSMPHKTGTFEEKVRPPNGLTSEFEPSAEKHQTLGRTMSAQQTSSKFQSEFTMNGTQHFPSIQKQQQMQSQQMQLPRLHQQQETDQQIPAASIWSPRHASEKEMVEDVVEKVQMVICGGDRGIPPLETVFGLTGKNASLSPCTSQLQGPGREAVEGTVSSYPTMIKSPSALVDSSHTLLQSSNQIVPGSHIQNTLQRTLSGPGSPNSGGSWNESNTSQELMDGLYQTPRFVRDNSQYWHKPNLTRDEVVTFLKDKPPGSFIIRNSNTFQGAYGLAIKVAQIPPNVQPRSGDLETELVRHFLIESTPKGVRLKGCSNEPTFVSLAALVYQHSITPLALPCKLLLPDFAEVSDGDTVDTKPPGNASNQELIAACNVLYISSIDLESLTGPEAISRAIERTFNSEKTSPTITEVHFKITSVGITLTDNKRRLFFRRHYPFNTITHCGLDAKDRRWTVKDENEKSISTGRVFGFVARKLGSTTENSCHLFSELDSTQSAASIVNAFTKVMISSSSSVKS